MNKSVVQWFWNFQKFSALEKLEKGMTLRQA
jgi:hypothetical protein